MNRRALFSTIMVLGLVVALTSGAVLTRKAHAQEGGPQAALGPLADVGTGFTYQGRLLDNGTAVDSTCDFRFSLYDDSLVPSLVAGPVDRGSVQVSDGQFSTSIDFGANAFTGEGRQLQIAVRCPAGSGSYTTLTGMVQLSAAPYAHSLRPGAAVSSDTAGELGSVLYVEDSYTGVFSSAALKGQSTQGAGVLGESSSGNGVEGQTSSGHGVYGEATNTTGSPYGVYGLASSAGSPTSYGVYGKSNSSAGTGVGGEAPMNGVYGKATAANGYGVYGQATAGSGTTYGVYGTNSSTTDGSYGGYFVGYGGVYGKGTGTFGAGVRGTSTEEAGGYFTSTNDVGVFARSENSWGVYGYAAGDTGATYGVYGRDDSTSGEGVYGYASASGGTTYGVHGKAVSLSGRGVYGEGGWYGVYGEGTDPTGLSMGVYGKTDTTGTGYGVYGVADNTTDGYGGYFRAVSGTGLFAEGNPSGGGVDIALGGDEGRIKADDNTNSSLQLESNAEIHLHLDKDDNDTTSKFEIFPDGDLASVFEIDQDGDLYTAGDLGAGGTKPATVSTEHYGRRKLYAVESPEVWFEDFGTGTLAGGVATILVEPIFAETVNLDGYHVFLTPLGDCNGLYVTAKTEASFEVHELGGGTSDVSFDYRLVAKRLGYEDVRLGEAGQ